MQVDPLSPWTIEDECELKKNKFIRNVRFMKYGLCGCGLCRAHLLVYPTLIAS